MFYIFRQTQYLIKNCELYVTDDFNSKSTDVWLDATDRNWDGNRRLRNKRNSIDNSSQVKLYGCSNANSTIYVTQVPSTSVIPKSSSQIYNITSADHSIDLLTNTLSDEQTKKNINDKCTNKLNSSSNEEFSGQFFTIQEQKQNQSIQQIISLSNPSPNKCYKKSNDSIKSNSKGKGQKSYKHQCDNLDNSCNATNANINSSGSSSSSTDKPNNSKSRSSSSSNSCNCDITGDNSTLHGFGVGVLSTFLGEYDSVRNITLAQPPASYHSQIRDQCQHIETIDLSWHVPQQTFLTEKNNPNRNSNVFADIETQVPITELKTILRDASDDITDCDSCSELQLLSPHDYKADSDVECLSLEYNIIEITSENSIVDNVIVRGGIEKLNTQLDSCHIHKEFQSISQYKSFDYSSHPLIKFYENEDNAKNYFDIPDTFIVDQISKDIFGNMDLESSREQPGGTDGGVIKRINNNGLASNENVGKDRQTAVYHTIGMFEEICICTNIIKFLVKKFDFMFSNCVSAEE